MSHWQKKEKERKTKGAFKSTERIEASCCCQFRLFVCNLNLRHFRLLRVEMECGWVEKGYWRSGGLPWSAQPVLKVLVLGKQSRMEGTVARLQPPLYLECGQGKPGFWHQTTTHTTGDMSWCVCECLYVFSEIPSGFEPRHEER